MSTFVSVGNATQPFPRLLDAVFKIAPRLPQPVVIQHGSTPVANTDCFAAPFIAMAEFERLVSEAELLILHAGAGSVIHAVRAGKVPVLMPRRAQFGELVDDHQLEFARALAQTGRVILAEQVGDLGSAVDTALSLQRSGVVIREPTAMARLVAETLARCASTQK